VQVPVQTASPNSPHNAWPVVEHSLIAGQVALSGSQVPGLQNPSPVQSPAGVPPVHVRQVRSALLPPLQPEQRLALPK
jgi:hypothetical protein